MLEIDSIIIFKYLSLARCFLQSLPAGKEPRNIHQSGDKRLSLLQYLLDRPRRCSNFHSRMSVCYLVVRHLQYKIILGTPPSLEVLQRRRIIELEKKGWL